MYLFSLPIICDQLVIFENIWRRGIMGLPAIWQVNSSERMEFWSFFRVWKRWQNDFSMFWLFEIKFFLFSVRNIGIVILIGNNNFQIFMRTNIVWIFVQYVLQYFDHILWKILIQIFMQYLFEIRASGGCKIHLKISIKIWKEFLFENINTNILGTFVWRY